MAVASIKLSVEERTRILKELGVDGADASWLPESIEIHRASPDDDVSGFLQYSASPPLQASQSPRYSQAAPKFQQQTAVAPWVLVAV